MAFEALPFPWAKFFEALDRVVAADRDILKPLMLHCVGGFVLAALHGLPRPTNDLDVIEVAPAACTTRLLTHAGPGSSLARQYGVYIHAGALGVTTAPYEYAQRLVLIAESQSLRLLALDPIDLALSKLARNSDRDREDVLFLAGVADLNANELQRRYRAELRPYLPGRPETHDLTLDLWLEMLDEQGEHD